jgi:hypothetical protein
LRAADSCHHGTLLDICGIHERPGRAQKGRKRQHRSSKAASKHSVNGGKGNREWRVLVDVRGDSVGKLGIADPVSSSFHFGVGYWWIVFVLGSRKSFDSGLT